MRRAETDKIRRAAPAKRNALPAHATRAGQQLVSPPLRKARGAGEADLQASGTLENEYGTPATLCGR